MVITALTRNEVTGNRTWVRIPPAPPTGLKLYSLSPIILLIAGVLCALCSGVPVSLIALFVQVFDITIGVNQMNSVSGTAGQGMCGTVESDMELNCTGKTQLPDDDTCREGSNPLRPANGALPTKNELSCDGSFFVSMDKAWIWNHSSSSLFLFSDGNGTTFNSGSG